MKYFRKMNMKTGMEEKLRILIVGCGCREHALAQLVYESSCEVEIYCIGTYRNPGILKLVKSYGTIKSWNEIDMVLNFAMKNNIDIAIIGGETLLERGLSDMFWDKGIACIGPTKSLSKLETSKSFCRKLLMKYGMKKYCPNFKLFSCSRNLNGVNRSLEKTGKNGDLVWSKTGNNARWREIHKEWDGIKDDLLDCIRKLDIEGGYVIKPDGLMGGKGVKVSGEHLETIEDGLRYCKSLFMNNQDFLLEAKLVGQEFSLFSFSDGKTLKHMPIIRDFKRLNDDDSGPNTGGMGSISFDDHSMPFLTEEELLEAQDVNEKVIENLQFECKGSAYIGFVYGGFMKTDDGLKVIEYNVRLGDPEAMNLSCLLRTDFVKICLAMINSKLDSMEIEFSKMATKCIYIVPNGYPENKVKFSIPKSYIKFPLNSNVKVFMGGIELNLRDELMTTGSRTLSFVGIKDVNLNDYVKEWYANCSDKKDNKCFEPHPIFHYRKDIGLNNGNIESIITYKNSGVDVEKGNECVERIKPLVKATQTNIGIKDQGIGGFGGMFKLPFPLSENSYLVSSTDSVGSKSVFVTNWLGKEKGYKSLGHDLVNHCVNDILCTGCVQPLFFLDYYAANKLDPNDLVSFVKGVSEACINSKCALVGGETAEIPALYKKESSDLVGMIVGLLDNKNALNPKETIKKGDLVYALAAVSPHTNGYTLIQHVVNMFGKSDKEWKKSADMWCKPHRCYLNDVKFILFNQVEIKGLCHITGGGLIDNPPRILPDDLAMTFYNNKIPKAKYLDWIVKYVQDPIELLRTFNCGIGMLVIVDPSYDKIMESIFKDSNKKESYCFCVGEITDRKGNESVLFK